MKAFLLAPALLALAGLSGAQTLTIPPGDAGNPDECFNSEGDGLRCCDGQRSGSWVTGDSDCVKDVSHTPGPGGFVNLSTGAYHTHVVDYRVQFNQGEECGRAPIVETPHHPPFVLEFSRYFRTRASYVDFGLTKGWVDNYFFQLHISEFPGFRSARLEMPSGVEQNWVDPGTGIWQDDTPDAQSMLLTLVDEPGDQHLVTDRWGGKYHFIPEPGFRTNVQYLCDWLEDENGNRISITYANGYPTLASDGFGRSLSYFWSAGVFNGTRHLTGVVLPDGAVLQLQYFLDGFRTYQVTYPNGDRASYGRGGDADGGYFYFNDPLVAAGGRKDRVFTYQSGPSDTGRVRGVKDEGGHVKYVRIEQAAGPEIVIEHDDGRKFSYDCAFSGLNQAITNLRTGAVTQKEWQANGGLLKVEIDALGRWTNYDYDDARALETRKTYPDGSSELRTYNALNRVVDHTDRNGNVTHHDYDVRGNLIRRTHADASFEEWTRHVSGRVTSYRDRNGNVTQYQYDGYGNVSRIIKPADGPKPNPEEVYAYDLHGRVLSHTDPEGRVTTYEYDSLHRLVRTTYPDLTAEEVAYGMMDLASTSDPVDTAGLVVARTDRNGNVTSYGYGRDDRLESEGGAPGSIVYTYDAQDRLLARNQNGDEESYAYDSGGRRTAVTRVPYLGRLLTTATQYDLLDRPTVVTDPYGFTTTTSYDNAGRVLLVRRQIDAGSSADTIYTYDGNGNVLTERDPNGHVRSFLYDSNDRLIRAYDPAPFDANFVEYSYDFNGNELSRTDQEGNTRFRSYTTRNMLRNEMDASGNTVLYKYFLDDTLREVFNLGTGARRTFAYACCGQISQETILVDGASKDMVVAALHDGNGNVVQGTDGEGFVWQFEYDARDRRVRQIDPLGEETLTSYFDDGSAFDSRLGPGMGSAVTVTDPNGNSSTRVYDGIGRLFSVIDGAGKRTSYAYDALVGGAVESVHIDPMGHQRKQYHDGLGRLVRERDGLGNETLYLRDQAGLLHGIQDANLHTTVYTYDALGRVVSLAYPLAGSLETFSYLANGWLLTHTDQESNTRTYSYDGAGRVLSITYQDGSVDSFDYDVGGRLVRATSGLYDNDVTFTYDLADRIVREVSTRTVEVDYDRRSLKTRITTPEGIVFQKVYDARGKLDQVKRGSTTHVDLAYDAGGRLIEKAFANGVTSSWTYEQRDLVRSIRTLRGGQELLNLSYTYDDDGKKTAQRNQTFLRRSESFSYDAADRLVGYTGKLPPVRLADESEVVGLKGITKSMAWTLDPLGNWTQFFTNGVPEGRFHNEANQAVDVGGVPYEYDKNGNLLDDGQFEYTYDYNNRLQRIVRKATDDPIADYGYDALGRRIVKNAIDKAVVSLKRFVYFYDGEQIVEIREKPSASEPDEFFSAVAYGSYVDEPLVQLRPPAALYYHPNSVYSVMAVTNAAGNVVERYEYDPYGATQAFEPDWTDPSDFTSVGNPFTFHGRQGDFEANLVYFRRRSLHSGLGRFMQRDPEGYDGGSNLYTAYFVPNGVDPMGTTSQVLSAARSGVRQADDCGCRD